MKYFTRQRALQCLLIALMFGVTATVCAQDYPNRDIRFIVPFGPGGGADLVSRQFAAQLEKTLPGTVNIENKPGGTSTLGIGMVVRAKPDGYTIGFAQNVALVYLPLINKDVAYHTPNDYQPVVKMVDESSVLLVRADAPWKTFKDFIDAARKNPGKIRSSVPGVGSTNDLATHHLNKVAGVKIVTVPFSGGSGEATMALLGGRVEATTTSSGAARGLVQAGKLRALAVFRKTKSDIFPDATPTFEAGYDATLQNGIYLITSKGVPKNVLDKLVAASLQALRTEEFLKFAKANGYEVTAGGPEAAMKELAEYAKIISGLKELISQ